MLAIVADLFIIYLFALITGVGLYRLVAPGFLKHGSFSLLFIPALGLLQLTIVSAYVIFLSAPVIVSLYVSAVIGLITLVASVLTDRAAIPAATTRLREILQVPIKTWTPLGIKAGLFAALLAIVMAPLIHAGMPTTPYRIGIDQVGYGEAAQYLLEGGTIDKARTTLLSSLNITDMTKAKAQNLKALNFETYVDSEFFQAKRLGKHL